MTNIESFNAVRDAGLKNSNFLVWTGLMQSVPLKLRVYVPNFEHIFDLEKFKLSGLLSSAYKAKIRKTK